MRATLCASSDPTPEARRKPRDRAIGDQSGSGKAAGEDGQEERESQMSKGEKEEQFHE
jgi:hypothetical protein